MSTRVFSIKPWPFWSTDSQKLKHALGGLENFTAHHSCLGIDGKSGLALDEVSQQLCLITVQNTALQRTLYSCRELGGSEIIEDDHVVASSFGSAVGAASVARGGTVKTLALRLMFNEPTQPDGKVVHIVKLLDKPVSRQSTSYKAALDTARQWHRLLLATQHVHTLRGSVAAQR